MQGITTLDRIITIIRGLGYDRDKTADGAATLIHVAGDDELDAVDLICEIEEEFSVTFPDETVYLALRLIATEVDRQVEANKAERPS